jgi:hypothetical protein
VQAILRDAAQGAAAQDDGSIQGYKEQWPLAGPLLRQPLVFVTTMRDDHHLGGVVTPAFVQNAFSHFMQARAEAFLISNK